MTKGQKRNTLIGLGVTLAANVIALVLLSDQIGAAERAVWVAAIALLVATVVLFAGPWGRRAVNAFALGRVRFAAYGLRLWADREAERLEGDHVWEWFTDQLLAAQRRYATSVGCIAFEESNGSLRCLLTEQEFEGFEHPVLLWPGGRFRGALDNLERELQQMVHHDTGCNVELLAVDGGQFRTDLPTYNPDTNQADIINQLFAPPLFVMQQNRKQYHGVPGHVDVVFLGRVLPDQKTSPRGRFVDVDRLHKEAPASRLWPDTVGCIKRAAEVFNNLPRPVEDEPTPQGTPRREPDL